LLLPVIYQLYQRSIFAGVLPSCVRQQNSLLPLVVRHASVNSSIEGKNRFAALQQKAKAA
jgi:hypothetical protein